MEKEGGEDEIAEAGSTDQVGWLGEGVDGKRRKGREKETSEEEKRNRETEKSCSLIHRPRKETFSSFFPLHRGEREGSEGGRGCDGEERHSHHARAQELRHSRCRTRTWTGCCQRCASLLELKQARRVSAASTQAEWCDWGGKRRVLSRCGYDAVARLFFFASFYLVLLSASFEVEAGEERADLRKGDE